MKDQEFNLKDYDNIFVIGGGKASYKMAETINKILKNKIRKGFVNSIVNKKVGNITISKAGHPCPDENGMKGVQKLLSIKPSINDLVICLISGGGSAMLPLPVEEISLNDLKTINDLLLKAGANIHEVNTVRKHLSQVKGGRLAKALHPATIVSLIISDVIGDDLSVIASGPTSADKSTFKDAILILENYNLTDKIPKNVLQYLTNGVEGKAEETVKENDAVLEKVHNFILANNLTALKAMEEEAKKLKLQAVIEDPGIKGEARNVGKYVAEKILETKPSSVMIFGGETTVTVKGKGLGGRNQELILSIIEKIKDKKVTIASVGTDGIDFYKAAGAIADGNSYKKSQKLKLDIQKHLDDNDSYTFFKKMKDQIMTGYTGTNVCDIIVGVKK
ncbi:MAG: glycerate kinase [Nanoarchaeota archaeon]|nr:glycerate kinase [Nanoarchaeota archaeon]